MMKTNQVLDRHTFTFRMYVARPPLGVHFDCCNLSRNENNDENIKRLVWQMMIEMNQVVKRPPPGVDFAGCKEEEEGLCCLGYVSL